MLRTEPAIQVDIGRTNTVMVDFGFDVSGDTITSQIRAEEDRTSQLLATWSVAFDSDGTDGLLVLTLDDSDTLGITRSTGYMDFKRVTGGEPVSVIEKPILVRFQKTVTA